MAIMKIRGGDLDLVEYEFTSFSPGENIRTLGYEGNYSLVQAGDVVTVTAPARIHLTVLDMNRFSPDRPGGGGIGFAIQVVLVLFQLSVSRKALKLIIPVPQSSGILSVYSKKLSGIQVDSA